jgi:hypothetical protein
LLNFSWSILDFLKEEVDRLDVAGMLRTQSKLLLQQDYLKNANLFAADVKEAHNQLDRDELIEVMDSLGTD